MARHPYRGLVGRVVEIEALTHDIKRVRVAIEGDGRFDFRAGQYAEVTFPGQPARDYSMANQPGDDVLEFHIRTVEEGSVSHFVGDRLAPGDEVRFKGPFGSCYYREEHRGPVVALASGSGLAPIKAIVESALRSGASSRIRLYFSVRDEPDLYLEEHFEALAVRHPNLQFVPVLLEPSGPTARRTGRLADALAQDFDDLSGAKAYLAGSPTMVEACVAVLKRLGVRDADCHADPFVSMEEKARRTR